jgi:phosphopantothenoylcysteine synthetase/decarboxylase
MVCPATFNTVNKAAAGINDSYALGVLCEALGTATPVVMVPMVNNKLWGHPAWSRNLTALADAGVTMLDVHTGAVGASAVESGTGGQVVEHFDPQWLPAQLKRLRETDHR